MTQPGVLLVGTGSFPALEADLRSMLTREFRLESLEGGGPARGLGARHFDLDQLKGRPCENRVDAIVLLCSADRAEAEAIVARFSGHCPRAPILLITEIRDPDYLLGLLEQGVADFLSPPLKEVEVVLRLRRLLGRGGREDDPAAGLRQALGLQQLVGESEPFLEAIRTIPLLAKCDATVLIEGETGTGKEVCARAIHYLSARRRHPFVPVNCGAVPLNLVENELFGHEQEAFTGATRAQHGLVHAAEAGTLFLDEIDTIPPAAQVKLLRLMEQKEYRPLGSTRPRTANVRLLAASNTDMESAMRSGRVRQDFYYRLNVLSLRLPPLRERFGDIPLLARHFLAKFAAEFRRPLPTISPEAVEVLVHHEWPGNVRELKHVIERAVVLADGRILILRSDIRLPALDRARPRSFQQAKAEAIARFEQSYIENVLSEHRGNITRAARAAQKNRRAFWELIRKHGIKPDRFRKIPTAQVGAAEPT